MPEVAVAATKPLSGRSPFLDHAVIPLAVPLPPVDAARLRAHVQQHPDRCAFRANTCRYVLTFTRRPVIDGRPLLYSADPRYEDELRAESWVWDPVFADRFAELAAWFEALPFRSLAGIDLVTQTADIGDHLDVFGPHNSVTYFQRNAALEPVYYRVVFTEPGDEVARRESFYVTREHGGERFPVVLPEGTAAIAMSSSVCYHGAIHLPGHWKTTAVVYGALDPDAHLKLLGDSVERYGDGVIRFPGAGPVEGPGSVLPYAGAEHA